MFTECGKKRLILEYAFNFEKCTSSATVYGLWVLDSPYRVSTGYITKNTKVNKEIVHNSS